MDYCPLKNQDAKYRRPAPTPEPPTILERLVLAIKRLATIDPEKQKLFDLLVKKGLVTTA